MSEIKIRNEIVVFITTHDEKEAATLARALIEARLAACVNIINGIRSIYRWQGKVEENAEVLMIVKTRQDLFDPLAERVRELHSYDVPEIIAVPVTRGSEAYLRWINNSTGQEITGGMDDG